MGLDSTTPMMPDWLAGPVVGFTREKSYTKPLQHAKNINSGDFSMRKKKSVELGFPYKFRNLLPVVKERNHINYFASTAIWRKVPTTLMTTHPEKGKYCTISFSSCIWSQEISAHWKIGKFLQGHNTEKVWTQPRQNLRKLVRNFAPSKTEWKYC